jgi:excisionase family DNA binding protein
MSAQPRPRPASDYRNGDASHEQWLTTLQVAKIFNVSANTVRRHAKAGNLRYRPVGRQLRFHPDDIRNGTIKPERTPLPASDWREQIRTLDPYATAP